MKNNKNNNKKKKKLIILVISILLLVILFFVIYKVFFDNKIIITIKDGDNIVKIEAKLDYEELLVPKEKEGYKFNYYESNDEIFDINQTVRKSIVLKPIYIKENANNCKVKFVFNEFLENYNINVEFVKGESIILPTIPYKKGYIFKGWEDSKGNIIHSGITVTGDLIVVPIWEKSELIKANSTHTCEYIEDECEIDDENKCHCEKRNNALVKAYDCREGATYDEKNNTCITKENMVTTCNKGTYDETLGGCKITTSMVKTCSKGYLIQGKCYYNEIKGWTPDSSCNGYYFADIYQKCFKSVANTTKACPKGYKKATNSCYKIENPTYCKTGYELVEENGNKICIQKSDKEPVYSCSEGYKLDNYICIKKYIIKASKL